MFEECNKQIRQILIALTHTQNEDMGTEAADDKPQTLSAEEEEEEETHRK